jgi:chromosomal replication initiator protein
MTFDSFIPTSATIEAMELSQAVARSRASAPRLLLLCGPPGSGKTHLLRAIGHVVGHEQPSIPVVQTTADEVLQRWIAAIKRDEVPGPLWPPTALVTIDDLHTMGGKELAQREFARQMALALDDDIRFACAIGRLSEAPALIQVIRGLPRARIVRLKPPVGSEMSRLLVELARRDRIPLEARKAKTIAERCRGDVRRACGAIARRRLLVSAQSPGPR